MAEIENDSNVLSGQGVGDRHSTCCWKEGELSRYSGELFVSLNGKKETIYSLTQAFQY